MRNLTVKVHSSKANFYERPTCLENYEIASDKAKLNKDAIEMVITELSTMLQ